jgi:cation-transporting ATPase E
MRSVENLVGLTSAEVAERVAAGQVNEVPDPRSRSLPNIIRANTLTWFNALIGSMWVIMLLVAPIQDSLFGFVIVANTAIGIIQEYRASRTLAKLSVLGEAKPQVLRDGVVSEVSASEVVLDDVVLLSVGDQLVVDGEIIAADGLEIDESLLTGEADPVHKALGDQAMSGSFVVAGTGAYHATRVGRDSFAASLTEQARKFQQTNSELRRAVNRFIRIVSYLLVPVGLLLMFSQFVRADLPFDVAVRGTIAGMVTMVPEGLVLLTSIAMAVAVVRLAERRVLVQDLPAVEVLARVDTICVDKTGTLTEPGMQVRTVEQLTALDPAPALGALAAADPSGSPTLQALATRYADPGWRVGASVPFSSARKWSAADFTEADGQGSTWVLGAPEMLVPSQPPPAVAELAQTGARVLLLARARSACGTSGGPDAQSGPGTVEPIAVIAIDQQLRSDAAQTVAYFGEQQVRVIVISGDGADTVGAIATQAGVPGADAPVDARELPDTAEPLAQTMAQASVFGRVTPAQKQAMVDALHLRGSTVAMTGDGVNDVLALKAADLGIAMGSGADATRAVAQLVLLDNRWSVMPHVVAEGRRVLGNIERVSDVFLTKSCYAIVVSSVTAIFAMAFPFLPRHLSLISALTIGIPAFFLALMPNTERFRPGFFRRVLLFAVPAGLIAAMASLLSYQIALRLDEGLAAAQSAATVTLFIVATAVLSQAARPLNLLRVGIVAAMVISFLAVLTIPWLAHFFALSLPPTWASLLAVLIGLAGAGAVVAISLFTDRWRRPGRSTAGFDTTEQRAR